mgnify:CR=1 FL=1
MGTYVSISAVNYLFYILVSICNKIYLNYGYHVYNYLRTCISPPFEPLTHGPSSHNKQTHYIIMYSVILSDIFQSQRRFMMITNTNTQVSQSNTRPTVLIVLLENSSRTHSLSMYLLTINGEKSKSRPSGIRHGASEVGLYSSSDTEGCLSNSCCCTHADGNTQHHVNRRVAFWMCRTKGPTRWMAFLWVSSTFTNLKTINATS